MQAWNFQDLTGQTFGKLTVIKRQGVSPNGHTVWLCKCECGNFTEVNRTNLLNESTKSCGCYAKEKLCNRNHIHGLVRTPLYTVWANMKERCLNAKSHKYPIYGGRGITVCDEWLHDFQAFYDWSMANGYEKGLTLDRKDVNGNYEPSNCRWATVKQQANNTRTNKLITYNGKTQTVSEWADELGIKYSTLYNRLFTKKWDIKKALTTEVRRW